MHFKVHVVCSLIQLPDSGIFFFHVFNRNDGYHVANFNAAIRFAQASPSGELLKSAGFFYGTR